MNVFAYFCGRTEKKHLYFERFRKVTVQNGQFIYTICAIFFPWLGYLNARAPSKQATFILVQIPLSLLLQKEVFPLVVRNSYMVVDPSD